MCNEHRCKSARCIANTDTSITKHHDKHSKQRSADVRRALSGGRRADDVDPRVVESHGIPLSTKTSLPRIREMKLRSVSRRLLGTGLLGYSTFSACDCSDAVAVKRGLAAVVVHCFLLLCGNLHVPLRLISHN
jgi:hypothetical protein